MFSCAKSNKAPQHIFEQIRNAILDGRLKPGDRLPTENELMERFKVSKSTLREALRSLEILGLLEIKKGISGGPYVTEIDTQKAGDSFADFFHFKNVTMENFFEVRLTLEPYIVSKAALLMTEEDLKELENLITECEHILEHDIPIGLRKNELEFHRRIAGAVRNPILMFVLDFVENLPVNTIESLRPNKKFSHCVHKAHKRIFSALAQRDSRKARVEMIRHIKEVEKLLLVSQRQRSSETEPLWVKQM